MIPEGIDGIARIGLLFLDGDDFEEVLIDQEAHTDYRFAPFNRLRSCLSKIEVLDPQLDVSAILWRFIPGNSYVAEPIIAGNALPQTGWRRIYAGPMLRQAYLTGGRAVQEYGAGCASYYYGFRNSDQDIVACWNCSWGAAIARTSIAMKCSWSQWPMRTTRIDGVTVCISI